MRIVYLALLVGCLSLPVSLQAAQEPTGYGEISLGDSYDNVEQFFLDKRMKSYPVFGEDINVAFYVMGDYVSELNQSVSVQFFFTAQERTLYKVVVYIDRLKNEEAGVMYQKISDLLVKKYADPINHNKLIVAAKTA